MDSWEIPSAVGDYRVTKQWVGLQKSNSTVCSATMCLILEEQAKHVTTPGFTAPPTVQLMGGKFVDLNHLLGKCLEIGL